MWTESAKNKGSQLDVFEKTKLGMNANMLMNCEMDQNQIRAITKKDEDQSRRYFMQVH